MERPKELGKPLQDRWLSFPFQIKQLNFGTATGFHLTFLNFLNMLWAPSLQECGYCLCLRVDRQPAFSTWLPLHSMSKPLCGFDRTCSCSHWISGNRHFSVSISMQGGLDLLIKLSCLGPTQKNWIKSVLRFEEWNFPKIFSSAPEETSKTSIGMCLRAALKSQCPQGSVSGEDVPCRMCLLGLFDWANWFSVPHGCKCSPH